MNRLINILTGLALIGLLAFFTGCATHKHSTPPAPQSEPISQTKPVLPHGDKEFVRVNPDKPSEAGPADAKSLTKDDERKLPSTAPKGGLLGFFGRKATKETAGSLPGLLRKCKGCTFNVAGGNLNTSTVGKNGNGAAGDGAAASKFDKPKGSTINTGAGDLTNQSGATNAATAKGDNNGFDQVAVPPAPKLTPWQRFKNSVGATWSAVKWPLYALGAVAGVAALLAWLAPTSAAGAWVLAVWKRRKSTSTTTA